MKAGETITRVRDKQWKLAAVRAAFERDVITGFAKLDKIKSS